MAFARFDNVTLDYPVYQDASFSLRHHLIRLGTGGRIAKESGKKTQVRALSEISFEAKAGDRIGLIGHNGSGKSTFLRCLAGIYAPTLGKVHTEGTITTLMDVGVGVEPELSGYENIHRLQLLYGYESSKEGLKDIEDFCDLGDFLSLPLKTYSSGMLMRLSFAVIMSVRPDIFVMDEFFSAGDDDFKKKAESRIIDHISTSSLLFFASHEKDILRKFCNRFFVFSHGVMREENSI